METFGEFDESTGRYNLLHQLTFKGHQKPFVPIFVRIRNIVEHHLMSVVQQGTADVEPDESAAAGDEELHLQS